MPLTSTNRNEERNQFRYCVFEKHALWQKTKAIENGTVRFGSVWTDIYQNATLSSGNLLILLTLKFQVSPPFINLLIILNNSTCRAYKSINLLQLEIDLISMCKMRKHIVSKEHWRATMIMRFGKWHLGYFNNSFNLIPDSHVILMLWSKI